MLQRNDTGGGVIVHGPGGPVEVHHGEHADLPDPLFGWSPVDGLPEGAELRVAVVRPGDDTVPDGQDDEQPEAVAEATGEDTAAGEHAEQDEHTDATAATRAPRRRSKEN